MVNFDTFTTWYLLIEPTLCSICVFILFSYTDGNECDTDGNKCDTNGNECDTDRNECDIDGNECDTDENNCDGLETSIIFF